MEMQHSYENSYAFFSSKSAWATASSQLCWGLIKASDLSQGLEMAWQNQTDIFEPCVWICFGIYDDNTYTYIHIHICIINIYIPVKPYDHKVLVVCVNDHFSAKRPFLPGWPKFETHGENQVTKSSKRS